MSKQLDKQKLSLAALLAYKLLSVIDGEFQDQGLKHSPQSREIMKKIGKAKVKIIDANNKRR